MNYPELLKLKSKLIEKDYKTQDELKLLSELQSLSPIIDRLEHSLSLSDKVCKTCGRPL